MARGDLYIADGSNLFKLPGALVHRGDHGSSWQHLGPVHNVSASGFDIDRGGVWFVSQLGQDGETFIVPVHNEDGSSPGERTSDGRLSGRHAVEVAPAVPTRDIDPAEVATRSFALDINGDMFVATTSADGTQIILRGGAGQTFRHAWSHNRIPVAGDNNAYLPDDMSIRESDQRMAVVTGRVLWLRDTTVDNSSDGWFRYTVPSPPDVEAPDLRAVAWDHTGQLWIYDAEHVRMLVHARDVDAWHAPSTEWTLPERVAGVTVARESINAMAFDQRGGTWNIRHGADVIRGIAWSDADGSHRNIIGGRLVDAHGNVRDIAGGGQA